jgi:nicotinate phosphoribosyltransferase
MNPLRTPLLTDLYQLTMLEAYFAHDMQDTAVFEFFVRRLPPERGFLVAAGLEELLVFLENLRFGEEELAWVRTSGHFGRGFAQRLAALRFSGDVHAMPEGTVFYADEPIVRVTAPMPQAQLIESRLINLLHFETLIASKAARCVLAAPGKLLIDFGLRRAHGAEAGLLAARASYIAGFAGTATAPAAPLFGIPVFGTMAHSFIEAHDTEESAFERFAAVQPGNVTLLIDTYDTEAGARKVARLAPRLRERGITVRAVRLDSGDLAEHARRVRRILDAAGLHQVGIFSSGSLDEIAMRRLLTAGAPIDGFGVGTIMDTSADAPYIDCAYKLQEYAGRARRKHSEGKATWPGRKQVYRRYDADGVMAGDVVTCEDDAQPGEALIAPVMKNGKRLQPAESLDTIRARVAAQLRQLPPPLRALADAPPYPVVIAPALKALAAAVDRDIAGRDNEAAEATRLSGAGDR